MPSRVQSRANALTQDHTLKDLLSRWVKIDAFKWTSGSVEVPSQLSLASYLAGDVKYLRRFALPQAIFDNSPLIREKINNFMLMRAGVQIEVKANAEPFQQGALILAYFPRSLNTSKFRAEGNEFLSSITSAPHQVMYLEQANQMTMTVPFAHIKDMIDLTDSDDTFGYIHLYSLGGLSGPTDSESVELTTRMRFVDIDPQVSTDNSILASQKYAEIHYNAAKANYMKVHGLRAQVSEGEKKGPVTRISSGLADVADVLSIVPGIGQFAAATGWFFRMVNKVATVFGWSKPVNQDKPAPMYQRTAGFMGNTEGPDSSMVLAQIPDNSINSGSFVPSGQDELSHSFIFSRPNYLTYATANKTSFSDSKLMFSFEVAPVSSLMANIASNGQDFSLGAQSFAAALRTLWRGTIDYNIEMIKTRYHAGRFIMVYFPNRTRNELPEVFSEAMTTNHSIIYDLQAKDDEELSIARPFSIPYTSSRPWKKVLYKNENDLYDQTTLETHNGVVGVYSYNSLVCPDTVSDSVTFVLKHSFRSEGQGKMHLSIPTIAIAGGFAANNVPVNSEAEILSKLQQEYPNTVATTVISDPAVGTDLDFYDITNQTELVIDSEIVLNNWLRMNLNEVSLPDGTYTHDFVVNALNLDIKNQTLTFTTEVEAGRIVDCYSNPLMTNNTAGTGLVETSWSFASTVKTHSFVAQADEGASEPIIPMELGEVTDNSDKILLGTVGEYSESLRPLIKRFVHTRDIQGNTSIAFTPSDFINFDTDDTTTIAPVGARSWSASDGGGGFVPESWLNLVSYLYRFCAGSTNVKAFMGFANRGTVSLAVTENLQTEFGLRESDPSFVQEGVINNALEVRTPYYGQHRARVIGDQTRGVTAKPNILIAGDGNYPVYEAAGDDFNMWFMIGPPVVRPIDVNPVAIPVVTPVAPLKVAQPSACPRWSSTDECRAV